MLPKTQRTRVLLKKTFLDKIQTSYNVNISKSNNFNSFWVGIFNSQNQSSLNSISELVRVYNDQTQVSFVLYCNVYLWFYSEDFCLWRGTLWRFHRKVKETKMTSRRKWNLFKRHLSFTFEEQIKPIWSVSIWNHQL